MKLKIWISFFEQKKGGLTVSSIIFYSLCAIILVSIPITVNLINKQQNQTTKASNLVQFAGPPIIVLHADERSVRQGGLIKLSITGSRFNWYGIYFFESDPLTNKLTILDQINTKKSSSKLTISEGSVPQDISYQVPKSGYIIVVAYQLQNYLEDFNNADVACFPDGKLYIYEREQQSLIDELLNSSFIKILNTAKKRGTWKSLTSCDNSGVIPILSISK